MLKNIVMVMVMVPGISILFAYTKANIYSFWLGFLLCLITELAILIAYCFMKLQKAYRHSKTIKVQNHYLDFETIQKEHPLPTINVAKEVYLNKFTQQARLTNKRQSLHQPQLQTEIEQIDIDKVPYKQKVQTYLEQIRNQYHCLNYFNQALIDFGNRMLLIAQKSPIFKGSYQFAKHETCFVNEQFEGELQIQQKRALFQKLKIAVKRPKDKGAGQAKGGEELKNIVLPTWNAVLFSFSRMGVEFKQMQTIKQSNRQLLEMMHKKIMEDYQILEKQISTSVHTITQIKQNLENLRHQHQKLEKYQTIIQGSDNIEIIYWLKKQYFDFTNLVLRIKQNQKNYKLHTQKLIYCQAKIASFYQKQQHKYDQIMHTRIYALLDAYRITLEESLKCMKNGFNESGYTYEHEVGPPKVKQLAKSKNINEIIATEQQYQEEYFQRVDYYLNKIDLFRAHLEELDIFLNRFGNIFAQINANLIVDSQHTYVFTDKDGRKQRKALLLDFLFKALTQQTVRVHKITLNLERVNKHMMEANTPLLVEVTNRIHNLCSEARKIIGRLDQREGPLRQKYRLARQQLNHLYKEIEESITAVKQFQQIFQLHFNRIKKILICSITFFVANQKKFVMSYIGNDSAFKNIANQSDLEDIKEMEPSNEEKPPNQLEISLENVNSLETGCLLSEDYKRLVNRFFFVAYTEWSKSQLFRQTISKQIYIALNEQINEYFSEIVIQDFEASGLPPEIVWLKELKSQEGQFIIDMNISFRGRIIVKVSTKINFLTSISVEFELAIEEFYSIMRLCFIQNEMGCSWWSFVGEPLAKISVRPKIGNVHINMASVAGLLQNFILSKLKQSIYPIKKKMGIPMYTKDDSYEIIQKRYESMTV